MDAKKTEFEGKWQTLTYECSSVFLISRIGDEPFEVRYEVQFDGTIIPKKIVSESFVFDHRCFRLSDTD
jgi:hypothetical protein